MLCSAKLGADFDDPGICLKIWNILINGWLDFDWESAPIRLFFTGKQFVPWLCHGRFNHYAGFNLNLWHNWHVTQPYIGVINKGLCNVIMLVNRLWTWTFDFESIPTSKNSNMNLVRVKVKIMIRLLSFQWHNMKEGRKFLWHGHLTCLSIKLVWHESNKLVRNLKRLQIGCICIEMACVLVGVYFKENLWSTGDRIDVQGSILCRTKHDGSWAFLYDYGHCDFLK